MHRRLYIYRKIVPAVTVRLGGLTPLANEHIACTCIVEVTTLVKKLIDVAVNLLSAGVCFEIV